MLSEAEELLQAARRAVLSSQPDCDLPSAALPVSLRDRLFYSSAPLGLTGRLAFVFPGSGNDFPGMGRDLSVFWPDVLRRQQGENLLLAKSVSPGSFLAGVGRSRSRHRDKIFGQVALGTLVSDLLVGLGVQPDAAIGCSLGESAALFALRAWTDRDGMLQAMHASALFTDDLVGRCIAARTAWGLSADETVSIGVPASSIAPTAAVRPGARGRVRAPIC